MTPRSRACPNWVPRSNREARARLGLAEADAFLTRLEPLSFDITEPLGQVYGARRPTCPSSRPSWCSTRCTRPPPARRTLRLLDRRREIDPAWFQRSRMIGYVCYADRFAGSLPGSASTWTTWPSWASPTCT